MKNGLLFPSLCIVVVLCFSSCKDIIEPSIEKKQVVLNAPGDHYQSKNFAVTFWWNEVEDALQYRLQVVTPSFRSIGTLITDTVVTGNKFLLSMSPGEYEWRVQAVNGSSQTALSAPYHFTVLSSSIKQQQVQLQAPADQALSNKNKLTFSWAELYGASAYRLEIDTADFADTTHLVYDQTLPARQYAFTFPREGSYQWRVRAQNDTARSLWSAVRRVNYDHSPPAKVTLVSPANDDTKALPVKLSWNAVSTALRYKLYVFKADSTSSYSNAFPIVLSERSYNFNTGQSGERIYWKVSGIDAAGNEGPASTMRSFLIQ